MATKPKDTFVKVPLWWITEVTKARGLAAVPLDRDQAGSLQVLECPARRRR